MAFSKHLITYLFSRADIRVGGSRSWDIEVTDPRFFRTLMKRGSLGLGEAYMDGWWRAEDLEAFFYRCIKSNLYQASQSLPFHVRRRLLDKLNNQQNRNKSVRVARQHYNLGNDLFFEFLGHYKNYSCGYFRDTDDLCQAQLKKMQQICREMAFKSGERVLDVGGGWGEIARHVATNHECQITSINISDEQITHARRHCAGLPVEIKKLDYRDLDKGFDKILVIAMLTHVGPKNYRVFMETLHRCLEPGGTVLIESVGSPTDKINCEPWTDKYIFPGGVIPSLRQIDRAIDGLFTRERTAEFGDYYHLTMRAWHENFTRAWPQLQLRYPEKVRLMFEYFFLSVAAAFRARSLLHWHIVLRKK